MKTCAVITGGTMELDFAGSFFNHNKFDKLIAVDGGLNAVRQLNLIPDAVVGDFDTASPDLVEEYRQRDGILWDIHTPEKDETDTELALNTAIRMGCDHITLLGATGGRMDHALGNLHLLYPCLQKGIFAEMVDSRNRIYLLDSGCLFQRECLWGKYISFLPLTEKVEGITLSGFKYPLNKKNIQIGTSLCISNELSGDEGTLSFEQGVLICIESHD